MWSSWWFSIWESCLTVIVSVGIGSGFAWIEHYAKTTPSKLFQLVIVLPIFLPPTIVALGFILLLGKAGSLNSLLVLLHLSPMQLLYSPSAVILAQCYYNIPLAYLGMHLRLQQLQTHLEDAAYILGASPWQRFLTITLPRLKTTLIGISSLIFLYSFTSFTLPLTLGDVQHQTVEVMIYRLIVEASNFPAALYLAASQCIFLCILICVYFKQPVTFGETQIFQGVPKKIWYISLGRSILSCSVLSVVVVIMYRGFNLTNVSTLAVNGFWWTWFESVVLATSVSIGSAAVSALLVIYTQKLATKLVLILVLSPVTTGLVLLLFLGKSLFWLGLSYTILLIPIITTLYYVRWSTKPLHWKDTLHVLGATRWHYFTTSLHFLFPTLQRAVMLSYAFVLGDITLANLLSPYHQSTAMQFSYSLMGTYHFNLAITGITILLFTICCSFIIIYFFSQYVQQRFAN